MPEIIFEVHTDEIDGGFTAASIGHSIFTQGDTIEELRIRKMEAVQCHFGDGISGTLPNRIIALPPVPFPNFILENEEQEPN